MRSAGGTESAVTMLIADHVRNAVGLSNTKLIVLMMKQEDL